MSEIRERFVERHSKSAQLYEKSKNLFPDGVTHDARRMEPFPLYITHGQGPLKWDVDGNEFIDYFGGHGALILGHNHPEVVKAVNEQMSKGTQFAFNSELEMEWAEWIKKLKPSIEKVRFPSSGTEATMSAVRLARAYTKRDIIIKFEGCYHGHADLFLSFQMLEHLFDPVSCLHELASKTSTDYFVVTVPYVARSRVGLKYLRHSPSALRFTEPKDSLSFFIFSIFWT